ncbi:MAG: cell division protein FtsL [Deltaproteobacteria bacterium]|nr:cell division protein FtsL [Deltaproteobacteria bacterium]MBW1873249.1 cell division protein FtsL [Deltaproteobacteria bacterium]
MPRKAKKKKPIKSPSRRRRSSWNAGWTAGVIVILAFTFAAVVHVRSKLVVVELGYQLSRAASKHQELLTESRKLKLEVATLRNPRRLRKLAIEELGLIEPSPSQILRTKNSVGKVAATALGSLKKVN